MRESRRKSSDFERPTRKYPANGVSAACMSTILLIRIHGGRLMQPMMRIILPIIGLLIAASLGNPASRALDLLLGAAVGFLIADLAILQNSMSPALNGYDATPSNSATICGDSVN
jgi:hypothetical protein